MIEDVTNEKTVKEAKRAFKDKLGEGPIVDMEAIEERDEETSLERWKL